MLEELLGLTDHILGEPDPAPGIDDKTDSYTVERGAGRVDAMPTGWRLVNHALLHSIDATPWCWIRSGQANAFSAVGEACKALVSNAGALIQAIGTGMAEATVNHVPAMQAGATGQRIIPDKWVEAADGPVMIDQCKELLGQLDLFAGERWRRAIRGKA